MNRGRNRRWNPVAGVPRTRGDEPTDAYGTKYFHIGIGRFGFGFREVAPNAMLSVLNANGNWVRRWNTWATSKLGGWGVGFVELHGVNYKVVTAFGRMKIYKERVRQTFKERMERKLMRPRKKSEHVSGRDFERQYTRPATRAKHGPIGRGGGGKW